MNNVNKLIYLPIITQVCIILKQLFHIEIGTDMQDAIAVIISGLVTLYGIWMNRHKMVNSEENTLTDEEKMYH